MPYDNFSAVDEVTLSAAEYSAIEGDPTVDITLLRSGELLDDILVPFRTFVFDFENAAIRMSFCLVITCLVHSIREISYYADESK